MSASLDASDYSCRSYDGLFAFRDRKDGSVRNLHVGRHRRRGAILVDGSWKKVAAGNACLLPPFVAHALKCVGKKP